MLGRLPTYVVRRLQSLVVRLSHVEESAGVDFVSSLSNRGSVIHVGRVKQKKEGPKGPVRTLFLQNRSDLLVCKPRCFVEHQIPRPYKLYPSMLSVC